MTGIRLENISKYYGDTKVIENLNLTIEPHEFVVLVGPSGCGKSTTLRMVAGLEDVTKGNLIIDEKDLTSSLPSERGIGMVFQNYALYPHMNVYENMAFALRIKKIDSKKIDEKVQNVASVLELTEYLDRKPKELSGGQRQRVAMGRAMVKEADIFLFDEPLSNLDAKLRSQMRTEIKRRHQENKKTTIYVTHDQIEAMGLADKLVIMEKGNIEQIGTPMEVYSKPANIFVASFIGNPSMNFFELTVHTEGEEIKLIDQENKLEFPLPKNKYEFVKDFKKVTVGIRPSDIFISTENDEIPSEWKKPAFIDVIEPLGKSAFINLSIGKLTFVGEIMGYNLPTTEKNTLISFNLNHIHLFDHLTGKSLIT